MGTTLSLLLLVSAISGQQEDAVRATSTVNCPPVIAPLPDQFGHAGELMEILLVATDPDGDVIRWSASGLPDNATVAENILHWRSATDQLGIHRVTVTATDGRSATTGSFRLYLSDPTITLGWTPPTSGEPVLPSAWPSSARPATRVVVSAGEIESASLVVRSENPLGDVTVGFGRAARDASGIEAHVGWRIVKPWMQSGHDRIQGVPRLVPELLLHDDKLVEVIGGENYVRLSNGDQVWISEPGDLDERLVVPIADFDVRDADELLPFELPAETTRQLWMTLDVPPTALAGQWNAVVAITASGRRAWIPITIEVLPVPLRPSAMINSVYYRARLDDEWPDGSISSEFRSVDQMVAELADMKRMGITNPTVYQAHDSPRLVDVLDLRAAAGIRGPLFHVGLFSGGRDLDAVRERVSTVLELVADYGIHELHVHGRDEARGDDLIAQRPNWEAVQDVGGRNFVAGYRTTAWQGEGNFDLMGSLQDLLVCAFRPGRSEAAFAHQLGSRILTYESPQAGHEDPELYRRNFGLQLWQADYDGVMTYAYMDSFGHVWNDFDHALRDPNFSYPTSNGVIPTLQAAGVREAIDDVRYLATLQARVDLAERAGVDSSAAEAWLAQLRDLPLGRANLDDLRARTIGYTLQLAGGTAPSGDLQLHSPEIGTRDGSGQLHASWSTTQRANSWVAYGPTSALGSATPVDPALLYHHTAAIPQTSAGYWQAHSVDSSGNQVSSAIQQFPGVQAPSVQFVQPADGEQIAGTEIDVLLDGQSSHQHALLVSLDDDLLGWWRFEDPDLGIDSSTWGRHGTAMGGTQVPGRHGMGAELDGIDDYIDIGDLGVIDGPATIEGWYRFGRFPIERVSASGLHSVLYHHPGNEHLYFRSTNEWFRCSSLLTPRNWHHIAVSWDGAASSGRLYVDGRPLEVNVQGEDEGVPPLTAFQIGRSFGFFEGTVDEVRVWGRVLAPDEIQASYDGAVSARTLAGLPPGDHTLQAWITTATGELANAEVSVTLH